MKKMFLIWKERNTARIEEVRGGRNIFIANVKLATRSHDVDVWLIDPHELLTKFVRGNFKILSHKSGAGVDLVEVEC